MHSFLDLLHKKGVYVYLVSGGFRQVVCICMCMYFIYVICCYFRPNHSHVMQIHLTYIQSSFMHTYIQMINPVAESLNIPSHRIYANNLLFNVIFFYCVSMKVQVDVMYMNACVCFMYKCLLCINACMYCLFMPINLFLWSLLALKYMYVCIDGWMANYQPTTGSFAGFDLNEHTSRDGGKPAVINQVCMYLHMYVYRFVYSFISMISIYF
jgi:hypothetical protein